jgi:hypothetical protein
MANCALAFSQGQYFKNSQLFFLTAINIMINYTNAEFRSILLGLGFLLPDFVDVSKGDSLTTDN